MVVDGGSRDEGSSGLMVVRGSSGLGNPVTTLYREVFNDAASWTDALFWYVLGNLSMAAIWWGWTR